MSELTIAVCTRDRPSDLARCVRSVLAAESPVDPRVEVLIVDDGRLPGLFVCRLEQAVRNRGHGFRYLLQGEPRGLIHGRVAAVRKTTSEILLFLDDDVEIDRAYLRLLANCYRAHPDAAGIGGIDTLLGGPSALGSVFARLFLLDSGAPGRLSPSGFSWSMVRWALQRRCFRTQVLSGSNMSFRRQALETLAPGSWLEGYSLGEDIYVSLVAAAHGPLWIDPVLRVRHRRSAAPRMAEAALAYHTIVNPYHLLQWRSARWWNYAALLWTIAGLILRELLRADHASALTGYFRGLRRIIDDLPQTLAARPVDGPRVPS